jgi:hypothetical protein
MEPSEESDMIRATAVFRASGSAFSPESVETRIGVSFSKKNEPGEIGTIGRYRGQPIPYGSAELSDAENGADLMVPNVLFFAAIEKLAQACVAAGATSVLLHIDVAFTDQCNIEMSHDFISAVGRLGIPVTMSCFEG